MGQPKWQGSGQVILHAANTFTGDIDVCSMPVPTFTGPGNVSASPFISSLVGQNVSGGNALGNTNGAVHLHCGNLSILAATGGTGQKKGALDFEGGSSLSASTATIISNYLTLASITRTNRGTLFFDFPNQGQQGNCRLLSTSAPPFNNSIMDAWGCWVSVNSVLGPDFATYDTSLGVGRFTAYGLLSSLGSVDAVVTNASGGLPGGGPCSAYALKVTSAITGTGTIYLGNTNKSSVAGLILTAGVAPDINFGGAEGMIIGSANATLSGKVSGTNGITIAGCSPAGAGVYITLANTNNDFTGQITVNNNELDAVLDTATASGIGTSSLGPVANPILLNGGILGIIGTISSTNTVLNSGRTITLGVCGGTLAGYQYGGGVSLSITVDARITGTGILMLCPVNDASQTFTITGTNNDYQGGTRVITYGRLNGNTGATLIAPPGATLGTGDLNVDAYRTATLQGTNNVAASAMVQVNTRATLNLQGTNNVTIGGLTGSGDVVLGNSAKNDTTLIVGGGNKASTFYGRISEASATVGQGKGSLSKTGGGTFTLYGAQTFTGPTTVNQGTLALMGSLTTNVMVSGGTLAGIGSIAGSVTVTNNGTLAPGTADNPIGALTIQGNLDTRGGVVAVDVSATNAYDVVTVAGNVTLGALTVTTPNGYQLPDGVTVPVITATGTLSLPLTQPTGYITRLSTNGKQLLLSRQASGFIFSAF